MKTTALFFLLGLTLLISCKKEEEPIPNCIQEAITTFSNNSCEHGATVKQYTFQGKTVYSFYLGYCGEVPTIIQDANCNNLGALGGYPGNTKINGEEFSNAKFVRTLWSRQ